MSRKGHDHAEVLSGATGSSTSMNNTTERRAMDSRSECYGTVRWVFRACISNLASDESLGYQHIGAFDYSTTAIESSWEPRGILQPKQKIEDSAKGEEM
ncbi:hypothetical protein B296_00015015 [Ensete ventricosum]|uniref:Uncharacterized protein n=1 Tax=Ensete ventricosum TaxID=4639 RepID=A0A426ZYY8_ENSVE|nr:hypothetical protein B296_00015015 [Ensete ventricosum]